MSLPFTTCGSTSIDLPPFLTGDAFAAFAFDLALVAMLSSVVSVPEPHGSHRSQGDSASGIVRGAAQVRQPDDGPAYRRSSALPPRMRAARGRRCLQIGRPPCSIVAPPRCRAPGTPQPDCTRSSCTRSHPRWHKFRNAHRRMARTPRATGEGAMPTNADNLTILERSDVHATRPWLGLY